MFTEDVNPEETAQQAVQSGLESSAVGRARATGVTVDTLLERDGLSFENPAELVRVWDFSTSEAGVPYLPFTSNPIFALKKLGSLITFITVIDVPEDRIFAETKESGWQSRFNRSDAKARQRAANPYQIRGSA